MANRTVWNFYYMFQEERHTKRRKKGERLTFRYVFVYQIKHKHKVFDSTGID